MSYLSGTSYFDPATGAVKQVSMYFYRAGTLDPITVFTTSALAIPHPAPVLSTGHGRVPPIWLGSMPDPGYRVRVFDQYSTLVEDIDNIPVNLPVDAPGGGTGPINPGDPRLYATGDLIFAMSNKQPRLGAVLCNGAAVGPTGSVNVGVGGRANNDTEALFKWLWGQDTFGMLPVIPSRGATAQGDWDLAKAITVPDLQGKVLVGMDAMGVPATNRLTDVPMSLGTQEKMGAQGGEAHHTLVAAEVPNHTHSLTDPKHTHANAKAALHSHPAFSGNTGTESANHVHSGTTNAENASHQHSYTPPIAAGTVNSGVAFGVAAVGSTTTTGNDNANHSHTFSTGAESAAHSHAFSVTIAQNTAQQVVTMDEASTGITISATTGGDGKHNNTPLFLTCAVYIKL
jgi:hypothetical protein